MEMDNQKEKGGEEMTCMRGALEEEQKIRLSAGIFCSARGFDSLPKRYSKTGG